MSKTLAVFSGVSGDIDALNEIIRDIKNRKVDEIICLGNVLSNEPDTNFCLDVLRENDVKVLLGEKEIKYLYKSTREKDEEPYYKELSNYLTKNDKKYLFNLPLEYRFEEDSIKLLFTYDYIDDEKVTHPFSRKKKVDRGYNRYLNVYVDAKVCSKDLSNVISVDSLRKNKISYLLIELDTEKIVTKRIVME